MCDSHETTNISRRSFAGMALATAGLVFVPFRAEAAQVDNLAIMCIDFRLVDKAIEFFDSKAGHEPHEKYDLIALAGASLAGATTGMFNKTKRGFWQQVAAARKLHTIRNVWVLDHMSCGAYAEEFNGGRPITPPIERIYHMGRMHKLKSEFAARQPGLNVEFYLAAAPGADPYPFPPERMPI